MDPYCRAKKAEEDLAKKDAKEKPKVRTVIDLIRLAGLDEDDIKCSVTLNDLLETFKLADPKKKDDGRAKVITRLKEGGVEKLVHRQKLASTFASAKRDLRIRPVKDEAGAGDEKAEARGAETSTFVKPTSKAELEAAARVAIAPLPPDVFEMALKGQERPVEAYLASGGHVDAKDPQLQATLLMAAALRGHEGLIHLLIRSGANLDLQNNLGGTALINAAGEGHLGVVTRLLQEGANATLRHGRGMSALEYAEGKHPEVAEALRKHLGAAAPPPAAGAGGGAAGDVSVRSEPSAPKAPPPPAIMLPAGQRVKIVALLSRPDLNGRVGVVSAFDAQKARYNVDVKGEVISLRPDSLVEIKEEGAAAPAQEAAPVSLS